MGKNKLKGEVVYLEINDGFPSPLESEKLINLIKSLVGLDKYSSLPLIQSHHLNKWAYDNELCISYLDDSFSKTFFISALKNWIESCFPELSVYCLSNKPSDYFLNHGTKNYGIREASKNDLKYPLSKIKEFGCSNWTIDINLLEQVIDRYTPSSAGWDDEKESMLYYLNRIQSRKRDSIIDNRIIMDITFAIRFYHFLLIAGESKNLSGNDLFIIQIAIELAKGLVNLQLRTVTNFNEIKYLQNNNLIDSKDESIKNYL